MKKYSVPDIPGVVCGKDNNNSLFIRKVVFDKDYAENSFHKHLNSFEFYVVLEGDIVFGTPATELSASENSVIYFEEAEEHKIVRVNRTTTMLLLKKIESTKIQL